MNLITPILSAVLQASSVTLDKITLSIKKITYKTYTSISFPLILLFNFIIFLIFSPPLSISQFTTKFIILIIISSVLSILGNILFYKALKKDYLNELEVISLLSNIPLIIITSIIFVSERTNIFIIALALISSTAIVWSHWKSHHFQIAKNSLLFLLFIILVSPFRGVISKILLTEFNPISLQLVASIIPAIFFSAMFWKSDKNLNWKSFFLLIATNILTTIAWILYYFSYQKIGVVHTVLIFSLQPLLVYFASFFILKEKFHWKKFVAFLIVLASIILAQII